MSSPVATVRMATELDTADTARLHAAGISDGWLIAGLSGSLTG